MASTVPAVAATVAKSIKEICRKPPSHWVGDGFHVIPVLANKAFTNDVSPFLMFDYGAPKEFPPTTRRLGVGQHPHRGFETVTVALQGEVEHGDSQGNKGVIGPGDVQWMTAARGIVHEEFHSTNFAKKGGVFEMYQIWVNLPSAKKMIKPNYQEIKNKDIPVQELVSEQCAADGSSTASDGSVRIIAGLYRGVHGAANTHSPVNLWDVKITNTERVYDFEIADGHTTLVFVRRGSVDIVGTKSAQLNLNDVAIMSLNGTKVSLRAKDADTQLLFLSGEPLNEPIAAQGPFVMNTRAELQQAIKDYQSGTNGF